jgi:hypothetical protein
MTPTRLARVALLALVACEGGLPDSGRRCDTDAECDDNDACTTDKCGDSLGNQRCVHRILFPQPAECLTACLSNDDCGGNTCCDVEAQRCTVEACPPVEPLEAAVEIQVQPGGASVDAGRSTDPLHVAYVTRVDARDDEVPVGTCAAQSDFPFLPPVPYESMGTMTISSGATPVAEIAPAADNFYFSGAPLALLPGSVFGLAFSGAGDVQQTTLADAIVIPGIPAFTELGAGGQVIIDDPTISYTSVPDATNLHIVIDIFENNQLRQIRCAADPNGTSVTLDAATFGQLRPSGGMRIEAIAKKRLGLNGAGRILVRSSLAVSKGYEML